MADEKYLDPYAVSHIREVETLKRLRLVMCLNCSCVYYSSIPSNIAKMYREYYRTKETLTTPSRAHTNRQKCILWHSILADHLKSGARILDIGCSEGFFVKFLNDRGHMAEGLEINELSVSLARESGMRIYDTDILEMASQYDLVFTSGYIEHVENPKEVIDHIRSLLPDDGLLYIQTPNVMSPNIKHLSQFFPAEHFQTFSPETMEYLLRITGFEIVMKRRDVLNCGMAYLARKSIPPI